MVGMGEGCAGYPLLEQAERSIAVERGPPETERPPWFFRAQKWAKKIETKFVRQRDLESSRS
jgi:hypothetical protein